MLEIIIRLLKQTECSYCQENDYSEKKEHYKGWDLYVKEEEMYSSLLLYNHKLKKDISFYTQLNDSISILDKNNNIILKLDYISNYSNTNYAQLVPDDSFIDFYETLDKKDKCGNEKINGYLLIDNINIQLK